MTEIKINIELNMSEKMQAFIASVFNTKNVARKVDLEIVEAGKRWLYPRNEINRVLTTKGICSIKPLNK